MLRWIKERWILILLTLIKYVLRGTHEPSQTEELTLNVWVILRWIRERWILMLIKYVLTSRQ